MQHRIQTTCLIALLGALAARTERVQLGTLVTGVTYRNPAILAKIVTTLDIISKGRAFLGIGAARSGTTWLHENLRHHPQVWVPPAKELHYFDLLRHGPIYFNLPGWTPEGWSRGGFKACCNATFSALAPRPPRFIGQSTCTSRIGSRPKRRGTRFRTTSITFCTPSSGSATSTK